MTVLVETPVIEFNPNTLEEIRKELNLNQDEIVKMLDNFEDWIAKQQHFTKKDFSRTYLETCLIHAKGSLEKAKSNLDKLCTIKTLLPSFFEKYDVNKDFIDTTKFIIHGTVPKILKNNYRLYILKLVFSDFETAMLTEFTRISILMSEYARMHDYSHGLFCLVDCRNINIMNFVTRVNIIDFRNSLSILIEGYAIRINAIYLISPSKTIDIFISLLKQVLSNKVAGRIHVVKTVEAMYDHVPKEILPKDYGGEEKTLKEINENWLNVLKTKENVAFFKEITQARTDEKYRLTVQYNDQVLGMPGSFRTLTVD